MKKKINTSTMYELIDMFIKSIKAYPDLNYHESRKIEIDKNNKLYYKIEIGNWTTAEKELLFIGLLKGLNIFYFVLTDKKAIPIGGFNSVMNAINGANFIYVNKKTIKWLDEHIKNKISDLGINFEN